MRRERRKQRRFFRARFEAHKASGLPVEDAIEKAQDDAEAEFGAGLDIAVILQLIQMILNLFDRD